jgi:hypothetical protein
VNNIDKVLAAAKALGEPHPIDYRVRLLPNQADAWRKAGLPEMGMVEISIDPALADGSAAFMISSTDEGLKYSPISMAELYDLDPSNKPAN